VNKLGTATVAALAAVGLFGGASAHAANAEARRNGDIRVFAKIAAPGEPSLTLVTPDQKRVFVGTFEDIEATDTSPSKIFEYSVVRSGAGGRLVRTFTIKGQTPGQAHGVQVAARDRQGRLYVLDQKPARIIRLNPTTGKQHTYATFADVPTCSKPKQTQCSNSVTDQAPEPDYAAWLPDGSLLVTDYSQQLVWRVPPHGGKARVWLNDKRLDGELFGPAGIVLMPGHHSILLSVATGGVTTVDPSDPPTAGRLDRVRIGAHDKPGSLTTLWSSATAQAPDGFAVSHDRRHIYLAEAGPTANCVDELVHTKTGWHLAQKIPGSGTSGSTATWDTATSVQFLHRSILVTNQSYFTGTASHWMVFDVKVPYRGQPIYVPPARLTRR
jgi:DNA-binding beta-propeller fold protein YncE